MPGILARGFVRWVFPYDGSSGHGDAKPGRIRAAGDCAISAARDAEGRAEPRAPWIKSRALARAHARRSEPAPVPWGLAAIFLFGPLAMLAMVAVKLALVLIALQILAPMIYARLDR